MAQKKTFRVGVKGQENTKVDVTVEEIASEGPATLLLINARDLPNLPTYQSSDIVEVSPVMLPLAPVGEVPGQAATDPRGRGAGKFYWYIVTDKLPTDPATAPNLPDLTNMQDLIEVWRYNLAEPSEIPAGPSRNRYQYTTDNVSDTGRYSFTPAFLDQAAADFEEYFQQSPTPGDNWNCVRVNQSTTSVTYDFSYQGTALPTQDDVNTAVNWMLNYLASTELENRRYDLSDAAITELINATPDSGILEDTWDIVSPKIEDGYGK